MASMTETQTELRLLMLKQRLMDQRSRMQMDSPLAKYSNDGLSCVLPCDMPNRNINNLSFEEYINSKGSEKNISKNEQETSVMTLKRTLNSTKPSKKIKTSRVASVPSSFFQGSTSTSSMKTNIDNATKEKVQKQPERLGDLNFFNKGILSKGYDSPLLYPNIRNDKNLPVKKELPTLYEQSILTKNDGEHYGKLDYPPKIADKQVEEIKYLSNNSNNLMSAMRTQSINYRTPCSSNIFKRNISKRKVEVKDSNNKMLVSMNNRLKRALAKSDSYTSSKKKKVTPNATVPSNFFDGRASFSSLSIGFNQEINEVEKPPVRSVDPSLFTTIRNNSKYDDDGSSEEELPSFENNNNELMNLSGQIMAGANNLSEYFSSKKEDNDYAFWQRVLVMEEKRSTMGLSIASTTDLLENMKIQNEVD